MNAIFLTPHSVSSSLGEDEACRSVRTTLRFRPDNGVLRSYPHDKRANLGGEIARRQMSGNPTDWELGWRCVTRGNQIQREEFFVQAVPQLADLQRILLRDRRYDAVQAQINNELAVVVRDVPDGGDGDAEARVGPGVGTLDAVERVLRGDRSKDAVTVLE